MTIRQAEQIAPDRIDEAIAVFLDAFRHYPVMTHVIGPGHADHEDRLRQLVTYFVSIRVWRGEPVFVARDGGTPVGAASMTLPGDRVAPDFVERRRDALWSALGTDARLRYDAYGEAMRSHAVAGSHHHLNMLGVATAHHGKGFARHLLDGVHALAERDLQSGGVSLTTEVESNLGFYQHFGYAVVGHTAIAPGFESWVLFRPHGKR